MRRKSLSILTAAFLAIFLSSSAYAAVNDLEDTDTRFVDAKVVEVSEQRIAIIARSGVEHVIALDTSGTQISLGGKDVRISDLRVGDIVTVVLDAESQLKLARQIKVEALAGSRMARLRE